GAVERTQQHAAGRADDAAPCRSGSRIVTRREAAEAGFTLIEVLVGVALLAMLATLIGTGPRMSGRAWNSAERQTTEIHDMDAVEGLLRRTIVRARPSFAATDP